jgi:hypothetical protein
MARLPSLCAALHVDIDDISDRFFPRRDAALQCCLTASRRFFRRIIKAGAIAFKIRLLRDGTQLVLFILFLDRILKHIIATPVIAHLRALLFPTWTTFRTAFAAVSIAATPSAAAPSPTASRALAID